MKRWPRNVCEHGCPLFKDGFCEDCDLLIRRLRRQLRDARRGLKVIASATCVGPAYAVAQDTLNNVERLRPRRNPLT